MSLVDRTDRSQSETLSFEFELRHPPEKVWRALTDPDLMARWLLPVSDLALAPEASFTLHAPPQPGWDGTVNCRFLEIDAPRRLVYTWVVGDLETVVAFTLTATAEGTLMKLEHSGFKPHQKRNFGGARYGWRMMGGRLLVLLDEAS